jgi:hypothetical protein
MKTSMIIYKVIENMFVIVELFYEIQEKREGKKNDRASVIS